MSSGLNYPPLTESKRQTWVQTEREAHEAWGRLVVTSPRAAALMHHLVAHMDHSAAVVASYATLAKLCGFSVATVRRAVDDLKGKQWLQVIQIGGKGGANAFVVNSKVAWATGRDKLHLSVFSARVIADVEEQEVDALDAPDLRRIPILKTGEKQLPSGEGEEPPSQPALGGLEHDLPSIQAQLEKRGQGRLIE